MGKSPSEQPPKQTKSDPALIPFLALLAADLMARQEAVQSFPEAVESRLEALAVEVGEVDPEAPIEGEVRL